MTGERGVADLRAGVCRRAGGLTEPGELGQSNLDARQQAAAMKTEEAVVLKLQAQTVHKQLQVGCSNTFCFL